METTSPSPADRVQPEIGGMTCASCAARIDQRAKIGDEFGCAVVAAAGWPGPRRIASLVGREAAVALSGEPIDDGTPAVVVLREAVQQQHGRPRAAVRDEVVTGPDGQPALREAGQRHGSGQARLIWSPSSDWAEKSGAGLPGVRRCWAAAEMPSASRRSVI